MTAPGHLVFPAGTWPRKKSLIYPLDTRWFSSYSWLCKRLPEGSWFYILRTINGDIVFRINWLYHMFGWTQPDSVQSSQNRPGLLRSLWARGYLVFPAGHVTCGGETMPGLRDDARRNEDMTKGWADTSWHELIFMMKTVRLLWIVAFHWQHMLETSRRFSDLFIPFYPTAVCSRERGKASCTKRGKTLCTFPLNIGIFQVV